MGIKKLALNLVLGAALVITPLTALALTPMSDSSMRDVTGQAGVSIGLDNIVIYQSIGETVYTDTDGWGAASEGGSIAAGGVEGEGSVVISDKEVLKQFNAILDKGTATEGYGTTRQLNNGRTFGSYGAGIVQNGDTYTILKADGTTEDVTAAVSNPFDGSTTAQMSGIDNTTGISPLTIDIGTCTALTTGFRYNALGTPYEQGAIAGVIIGLPTIEIVTSGDSYSVGIRSTAAGVVNSNHDFIKISKSDATMAILGGRLEIAAH